MQVLDFDINVQSPLDSGLHNCRHISLGSDAGSVWCTMLYLVFHTLLHQRTNQLKIELSGSVSLIVFTSIRSVVYFKLLVKLIYKVAYT